MAYGSSMPERIGRYDVVIPIARGGMATVLLARAEGHGGFDRYVALKLTAENLRDDPEFGQHLVEEAKLVAHLRHQNVVPVLDVGEHEEGVVFLVMDYVPGDSLGGLFKLAKDNNAPLTPRIGLRILVDALQGLHAAHEHTDEQGQPLELVHRDFSPQNILVGTDGIARLTDFGIAKAASRASLTMAGTMKGKVSYASPEQARGTPLDRRCDVWAAGVIAWEIFAGRKLFPASERTLMEVTKGPPQRLKSFIPNMPLEVDEAITRALGFEVDARTPTAQQFARELLAAARAYNVIAEVDEVADYVKRQTAHILGGRRQAIADARARRDGTPSSSEMKTMPLPPLPDLPTQRLANADTDAMPEPPVALPPAPAPPPSYDRWSGSLDPSVTPAGVDASPDPLGLMKPSLKDQAQRFIAEKPALAIGGAAAVAGLLLVIGIVAAVSGGKPHILATATVSHGLPTAVEAPPATVTTTTPPPSLGEAEPLPAAIDVIANAPIARLQLGKRNVEIEVPAPDVAVELTPDDSGPLAVIATSTDGRVADGNWNPGDHDLQLAFGDAPAAPAPVVARPKGKKGKKKR